MQLTIFSYLPQYFNAGFPKHVNFLMRRINSSAMLSPIVSNIGNIYKVTILIRTRSKCNVFEIILSNIFHPYFSLNILKPYQEKNIVVSLIFIVIHLVTPKALSIFYLEEFRFHRTHKQVPRFGYLLPSKKSQGFDDLPRDHSIPCSF